MQRSILIVEDDVDIRESLKEFLESEGHSVQAAGNGELALQLLEKSESEPDKASKVDLILLDLMMPVMNGVEFREQQAAHPKHSKIPVVVISADNRTQAIAEKLGLRWCLQKPMNLDELTNAVEHARPETGATGLRTGETLDSSGERAWKR